MRSDVKTLLMALTTERDALNRAITALKQMSELRLEATPTPAPRKRSKVRAKRFAHAIAPGVKAQIVATVSAAAANGMCIAEAAREAANETGISPTTIYIGWRRWQREMTGLAPIHTNGDGNVAEAVQ